MMENENEENKSVLASTHTPPPTDVLQVEDPSFPPSHSPLPDTKSPSPPVPVLAMVGSPSDLCISSDLSHPSSPSHGSSAGEEETPALQPSGVPLEPPSPHPLNVLLKSPSPPPPPPPQLVVNRSVRDEPVAMTKVDPGAGDGFFGGVVEGGGSGGQRPRKSLSILRRVKRDTAVRRAVLGFRVCGLVFCLISFSVMAADIKKGWAIDSFYRYKEFRYCISVNVIGFVYSVAQAYDLVRHFSTGKSAVRRRLRYYLDFSVDQASKSVLLE